MGRGRDVMGDPFAHHILYIVLDAEGAAMVQ